MAGPAYCSRLRIAKDRPPAMQAAGLHNTAELTIDAVSSIQKHAPLPLYRGVAVPSCWLARQAEAPLAVGVGLQVAGCKRQQRQKACGGVSKANNRAAIDV